MLTSWIIIFITKRSPHGHAFFRFQVYNGIQFFTKFQPRLASKLKRCFLLIVNSQFLASFLCLFWLVSQCVNFGAGSFAQNHAEWGMWIDLALSINFSMLAKHWCFKNTRKLTALASLMTSKFLMWIIFKQKNLIWILRNSKVPLLTVKVSSRPNFYFSRV